jgi:hypothetical protein
MKKNIFYTVIITLVIPFFFSGCEEPRYYQANNHHSDRYEHRHHRTEHSEIDVHLHN